MNKLLKSILVLGICTFMGGEVKSNKDWVIVTLTYACQTEKGITLIPYEYKLPLVIKLGIGEVIA